MALLNDLKPGKTGSISINSLMTLPTYTVAGLPPAAGHSGRLIQVSNGNAGQPCVAISNGTSWLRIPLGAAVAAT